MIPYRSYLVFSLLLGLLSIASEAVGASLETLETELFAIEPSISTPDQLEILSHHSPKILYLNIAQGEAVAAAKVALQIGAPVAVEFDPSNSEITEVKLLDRPSRPYKKIRKWAPASYKPSTLSHFSKTRSLFESVDSYTDADLSDNCFSRAHYWARTFEVENQIKSMKVFVLFTPLYRKEHNFNWWYHVAPYVTIQGEPDKQQIVLDPSYERAPLEIRDWVFHFASKANTCRIASSLAEYHAESSLGGCVVITASMYHYTPQDLRPENPKDTWDCEDLRDVQTNLRSPAPYSDWKKYGSFMPDYCL